MQMNATRPAIKWGFFIVVMAAAAAISISAFRIWLSDHWDSSDDPQWWERAAKLEPGNAQYWEHLGRYRAFDFEHADPKQAVAFFRRAAKVNPGYDQLWMDLAESEERTGETNAAREDFENARDAHPTSAEVHWRFGNFLIRTGDRDWGFIEIERALSGDFSLAANAINVCWEASHSVPELLKITPENSVDFDAAALDFFVNRGQLTEALDIWKQIVGDGEYFDMQRALPLVNALITRNDAATAAKIWNEAVKDSGWGHEPNSDGSVMFNGGFEYDIANGGLDWREVVIPGADFSIDEVSPHSRKRSLKITFDGSANLAFSNLEQYVPVKPNQKYEFSAYLKTEGITTESGLHFVVSDPKAPQSVQAMTQSILGTSNWTNEHLEITTGHDTNFLVIALSRNASSKLDNKLAGKVWVDDVSLRPAGDTQKGSTR